MSSPIQSDRGRLLALTSVAAWQEPGGFQLPDGVLAAVAALEAAQTLSVPDAPPRVDLDDVSTIAIDQLTAGKPVDLAGLAASASRSRQEAEGNAAARTLAGLIVERAGQRAVTAATENAEQIITGALQPAFAEVLAATRPLAAALLGVDLNEGGWNAPPKVREARRELAQLADRCSILRQARATAIRLGPGPQRDVTGLFAVLEQPQALVHVQPNVAMPRPDMPADPAAALLWLVGDGAAGKPWLPSPQEQDAAWDAVYGQQAQDRRNAATSALAHAGQLR